MAAITQSTLYVPPSRLTLLWRYLRRNKGILAGLAILLLLTGFTVHGLLTLDLNKAYPLSSRTKQPPYLVQWLCDVNILDTCPKVEVKKEEAPAIGALPGIGGLPGVGGLPGIGGDPSSDADKNAEKYWLGTDWYGRDLHTAMVVGLWQTALIGVFAGLIATIVPIILGFVSAYFGGMWDKVITGICSVLQPIPPFLIQVVLAASLPRNELFLDDQPFRTIAIIGAIVALTAWMKPTLVIRSQVLSMKERMFVNVAKLSGMGSADIIFKELLPNLLPFMVASFVNAVFDALFISFGLSVLGLSPLREPLLGNIIYFAQQQSAIFNGWWWWPLWPVLVLILIFAALTLINAGLDEVANPRARRTE